ncbi:MAG: helix-turn-helix transcriptional regulator, partial [Christensenellaceae bacterium]|nr:helix-turn-helix transcriptional regulator [Christensenellaceae bacterium]
MKRQTAKDILVASFRELAEKRTIDKITIKEITVNCGYSPATFYRHFNDKYDLIAWDYTRKL